MGASGLTNQINDMFSFRAVDVSNMKSKSEAAQITITCDNIAPLSVVVLSNPAQASSGQE